MTKLVTAFLVSLFAVPATVPLLVRGGLLDIPNRRSSHHSTVPRGGGVGVLLGFVVAALWPMGSGDDAGAVVLGAVAALAVLGLVDDFRGLAAGTRLVVQVAISVLAVCALRLADERLLTLLGAVAATIWLVGFTNVFNFMDGINGISAVSGVLGGGWYAWLGGQFGSATLTGLGFALVGCSLGFLPWNAIRPRVFLGDVGSYGVGGLLALLALLSVAAGAPPLTAGGPLYVYLADTGWALVKRVRRGDPWREAHREHVYQRLVDGGWSHVAVTMVTAAFSLVLCIAVGSLASWLAAVLLVGAVLGYISLPRLVPQHRRATNRGRTS